MADRCTYRIGSELCKNWAYRQGPHGALCETHHAIQVLRNQWAEVIRRQFLELVGADDV